MTQVDKGLIASIPYLGTSGGGYLREVQVGSCLTVHFLGEHVRELPDRDQIGAGGCCSRDIRVV
jgi:hypothetical protein